MSKTLRPRRARDLHLAIFGVERQIAIPRTEVLVTRNTQKRSLACKDRKLALCSTWFNDYLEAWHAIWGKIRDTMSIPYSSFSWCNPSR